MSRLGMRFSKLWGAAAISNFGDGLMAAAIPLMVLTLTDDPLLVSGAVVAGTLPWFLFALFSGALVDRLDRKSVMVFTNIMRGLAVAGLAWTVSTGQISILGIYLVAFALGLGETFFDSASEALVPSLVDDDKFDRANGRLQSSELLGDTMLGPPAGALMFGTAAVLPFGLNAVSFLMAALLIGSISGTYRPVRTVTTPIMADIREGLAWLVQQRVVRSLALMAGAANILITSMLAVFVLYAKSILGVSDVVYGLLLSALGLGAMLGALSVPHYAKRIGPRTAISTILLLQTLVAMIFVIFPSVWPAAIAMFGLGFGVTSLSVINMTLRQTLTPDELRGRVASAVRMVAWGSQPIGALLGGLIAGRFGLDAPYFVAGVGWIVIMLVLTPTLKGELSDITYVGRHRRDIA